MLALQHLSAAIFPNTRQCQDDSPLAPQAALRAVIPAPWASATGQKCPKLMSCVTSLSTVDTLHRPPSNTLYNGGIACCATRLLAGKSDCSLKLLVSCRCTRGRMLDHNALHHFHGMPSLALQGIHQVCCRAPAAKLVPPFMNRCHCQPPPALVCQTFKPDSTAQEQSL